jgi:octaprenyl-diphosphate synthase
MKLFGEYLGIAFQIKDDIMDYQPKAFIGKPTGNDIKEKKMTLPLIHVLNKISNSEKSRIKQFVKYKSDNKQKVNELIQFVKDNGGIDYAIQKMEFYRDEALKILAQFPDNDANRALKQFVDFSINRNK